MSVTWGSCQWCWISTSKAEFGHLVETRIVCTTVGTCTKQNVPPSSDKFSQTATIPCDRAVYSVHIHLICNIILHLLKDLFDRRLCIVASNAKGLLHLTLHWMPVCPAILLPNQANRKQCPSRNYLFWNYCSRLLDPAPARLLHCFIYLSQN